MRSTLRWLHLSDIHFREKTSLNQEMVFVRIKDEVTQRARAGWTPDLVLITGDLTWDANEDDFRQLKTNLLALAAALGLSRDRFCFCPGNHDSNIQKSKILLTGFLSTAVDSAATHKFVTSEEFTGLASRQEAYRAFIKSFYENSTAPQYDEHSLHSCQEISLDDLRVCVFSVNTSLSASGGENDRGQLHVCVPALESFVAAQRSNQLHAQHLTFMLMHHPFDWLVEHEVVPIEKLAAACSDIVFRGHLHASKVTKFGYGTHSSLIVAAGATYEGSQRDYEIAFGTLDFYRSVCTVEFLVYNHRATEWYTNKKEVPFQGRSPAYNIRDLAEELFHALEKYSHRRHLTASLVGLQTELAVDFGSAKLYSSIAAAEIVNDRVATDFANVAGILEFYGPEFTSKICADPSISDILGTYDRRLVQWSQADRDFKAKCEIRERDAGEALGELKNHLPGDHTIRFLGNLAASGDRVALLERLRIIIDKNDRDLTVRASTLLTALEGAPDGDTLLLFCAYEATALTFAHYRIALYRQYGVNPIHARDTLLACLERYPLESRQFYSIVADLAAKTADTNLMTRFRESTGGRSR